jgi:crotonobetainyl-CoA:carnitine CoA-transferase CaiB-like acyl-CoA transferase
MTATPPSTGRPIDGFPEHVASPQAGQTPLDGLTVLDFTHFVAGPACSLLLADLGADVIKIESTGRGDEFRYYPPFPAELEGEGAAFLWANRNKKSLAVNLKSPEGIGIARALIAKADVLVENFSTGTMDRLGLGYQACRDINPRLIYCSITAYGKTGTLSDRKGHDPIAQAESGFMSLNGHPDREGVRTGAVIMDVSTGLFAVNAVLAALHQRGRTGMGQEVEVALFDTAIAMLGYSSVQYLMSGKVPGRYGNTSLDTCPTGVFACQDGSFYMSCTSDRIFAKLAAVLGRDGLFQDPRFAHAKSRLANREALMGALAEAFAQYRWVELEPLLRNAGVPAGEYRDVERALGSKETMSRELVSRIPDPDLGWSPHVRLPVRMSEGSQATPRTAPRRGQHTREVLEELLGWSGEQIDQLIERGAVESRLAS